WNNSTQRVMRTDGSGRTYNLVGRKSITEQPTAVENAFELLDSPGEWYLDKSSHTVFYLPRSGENLATADVEAPVLEKLVDGRGTASATAPRTTRSPAACSPTSPATAWTSRAWTSTSRRTPPSTPPATPSRTTTSSTCPRSTTAGWRSTSGGPSTPRSRTTRSTTPRTRASRSAGAAGRTR